MSDDYYDRVSANGQLKQSGAEVAPPSPPDGPVAAPSDDGGAVIGAGLSLASCARLLSENSTEFSLRSPRSF